MFLGQSCLGPLATASEPPTFAVISYHHRFRQPIEPPESVLLQNDRRMHELIPSRMGETRKIPLAFHRPGFDVSVGLDRGSGLSRPNRADAPTVQRHPGPGDETQQSVATTAGGSKRRSAVFSASPNEVILRMFVLQHVIACGWFGIGEAWREDEA